jgi:hypothetical protein
VTDPNRAAIRVRPLSDRVRKLAHEKLDEALDMYVQGVPLWIYTGCGWFLENDAADLEIWIKETLP